MASFYTQKNSNIRKTFFLFFFFLIFIIGVGWIFAQAYGDSLILYIAIAFALIMNILAYWKSDKIALRLTKAVPIEKKDNPELYNIVENLAITAGLPMPKIYLVKERQPNAFATGRDPKHAVIAVTEGLLRILDRSELEGVIAHEMSHIGNRDILVSTVAVVLVGFIAILSDIFLRSLWFGGGRRRNNNGGSLFLILAVVAAILAPIGATLIQLAISRKREFLADASGVLLTRYPNGLINALKKISQTSIPMVKSANTATAHLWLDNPFKYGLTGNKKKLNFWQKIIMTHPPIEERIKALKQT
jgi:heat shock protein HtpX